jgi:hypothetical protein
MHPSNQLCNLSNRKRVNLSTPFKFHGSVFQWLHLHSRWSNLRTRLWVRLLCFECTWYKRNFTSFQVCSRSVPNSNRKYHCKSCYTNNNCQLVRSDTDIWYLLYLAISNLVLEFIFQLVRTPFLLQWLRFSGSMEHQLRDTRISFPCRPALPGGRWHCLSQSKGSQRPGMVPIFKHVNFIHASSS